ncbi:hypothetical protein [Aggregatimonas sangjinii]|uniref:hypothetical protein n=1 Tax=Aggregatimonas sangjinii TaxID=2583587 RepID=UPI0015868E16|nr:hypothetical protein [Aggregatimonas sangjinii]
MENPYKEETKDYFQHAVKSNNLQVAKQYGNGPYQMDENSDGLTDYEIADPDFSFVQFRSNLVSRWEYIPGSEIFLVRSQGVTGFGDPTDSLGRSLDGQILNQKVNNTFLIKATYRFVL